MPSLNSKSKNMYNRCLINVHINKASSEATSDSKELSLFGSNCVNTSLCCGKKNLLIITRGCHVHQFPHNEPLGLTQERSSELINIRQPRLTHRHAQTHMI